MIIRPVSAADAAEVAELLSALDYPTSTEAAASRLERYQASDGAAVLVAEQDGGDLVGLVAVDSSPMLAVDGRSARIVALVVADRARRRGVGRRLVAAAEELARRHGCDRLELTSGRRESRTAAHRFYPALGFEDTGHVRYVKPVQSSES